MGMEHFQNARSCGLMGDLVDSGMVVGADPVESSSIGADELGVQWVLRHPRVAFVSYPYEWSFGMLRDAALLTLDVFSKCLMRGFTLKDASAFNILFQSNTPVFIDIPSIEPWKEGTLWAGYGQFCRSFLFPLLVESYRGIDFRPVLCSGLGEMPVSQAASHFRFWDFWRPGILKDVMLQSRLERSFARASNDVEKTVHAYAHPRELLLANANRLRTIIEGLRLREQASAWTGYAQKNSYSGEDESAKRNYVERVLESVRPGRVLDLGCNTGSYTDLALRAGFDVVAIDSDAPAIDRLYSHMGKRERLSVVVANIARPTPAIGWGLRERASLFDRARGDFFLALALIHHLRISAGIPLEQIVVQLLELAPQGIVEWVDKDDDMVRQMLCLRDDVFSDYSWATFVQIIERHGSLVSTVETHGGRRRLCHVSRK
jgi:hypothetical protein